MICNAPLARFAAVVPLVIAPWADVVTTLATVAGAACVVRAEISAINAAGEAPAKPLCRNSSRSFPTARSVRSRGICRDSHRLSTLGKILLFIEPQQHGLPVFGPKPRHQFIQHGSQVLPLSFPGRVARSDHGRLPLMALASRLIPKGVSTDISRDFEQPGRQGRVQAQGFGSMSQGDEHRLRHVLGPMRLANLPQGG